MSVTERALEILAEEWADWMDCGDCPCWERPDCWFNDEHGDPDRAIGSKACKRTLVKWAKEMARAEGREQGEGERDEWR